MGVLRARLFAIQEAKRAKALGESRLAQVGTGERADKIRTSNFPQDRNIKSNICQGHHGGPRYGSTRSKFIYSNRVGNYGTPLFH
jgi:peptide chain release factor 1